MTLDNNYECMSVDPTSGELILRATDQHGTMVINAQGLLGLEAGKTYHLHIDVDIWHGNHRIELAEGVA